MERRRRGRGTEVNNRNALAMSDDRPILDKFAKSHNGYHV